MKISENFTLVPMLAAIDVNAGATTDSINMGLLQSACLIFSWGVIDTAGPEVLFYSGATAGATTTTLAVKYRWGSAAAASATADVLGAWSTSVAADGITASHSTADGKLLIVEIDSDEMTSGEPWLTVVVDADADACLLSVVAVCNARQPNATVIGA